MTKIKAVFMAISSTLVLSVSLTAAAEPTRTLVGKAYDVKTQAFVYIEDHVFDDDPSNASMTSRYLDPTGALIGKRVVRFKQDRVSDYTFKQEQLGIKKSLVKEASSLRYNSTKEGKTSDKSFNPKPDQDVIINAGLFNLIDREWSALLAGEKIAFHLALPDKKRTISMLVQRVETANSNAQKSVPNEDLVTFSMIISNRLLRWLVGSIELGYYQDTKQLAFYKGPSNLADEKGLQVKPIYIIYERSSPS